MAKQNFFWSVSFAECEKELSKHADEDGGNRKQVHRLIKMFYDRFWSKETKQLNSYMLKVSSTRVVFDVESFGVHTTQYIKQVGTRPSGRRDMRPYCDAAFSDYHKTEAFSLVKCIH